MAGSIYQSDPNATPDSEFLPGGLHHLVAGNRGRLLDARRTPVHVTGVWADDRFLRGGGQRVRGHRCRWLVPLESASSYQFAAGGAMAAGPGLEALREAVARCDVQITITAGRAARGACAAPSRGGVFLGGRLAQRAWSARPASIRSRCSAPLLAGRRRSTGSRKLYLAGRGLAGIEEQITSGFVSNPWAGDLVLGHLIVAAELGLGTLAARAPRDPEIFAGDWSKHRRADHILARAGFVQALWRRASGTVTLYRGVALHDRPATADSPSRRQSPLISATFSREVAESHFRSPGADAAVLYRRRARPRMALHDLPGDRGDESPVPGSRGSAARGRLALPVPSGLTSTDLCRPSGHGRCGARMTGVPPTELPIRTIMLAAHTHARVQPAIRLNASARGGPVASGSASRSAAQLLR